MQIGTTWADDTWTDDIWADNSWGDAGVIGPTRGLISFSVLEVPFLLTRGRISFTEFEVPLVGTRGRISFTVFETPLVKARGLISWVELKVPSLGAVNSGYSAVSGMSGAYSSLGRMIMRAMQGGNKPVGEFFMGSLLNASSNAAAVKTVSAVTGKRIVVNRVIWSYDDVPTTGKLTITGGSVTFEVNITQGGPGEMDVDYIGSIATDVVVTLAAGGSGITGKLNIGYTIE